MLNNFFSENHTVYEITWKYMVEAEKATDNNIIRRTLFSCYVTSGYTHTHSEYAILITLRRQHWLQERASILRLCIRYMVSLL